MKAHPSQYLSSASWNFFHFSLLFKRIIKRKKEKKEEEDLNP